MQEMGVTSCKCMMVCREAELLLCKYKSCDKQRGSRWRQQGARWALSHPSTRITRVSSSYPERVVICCIISCRRCSHNNPAPPSPPQKHTQASLTWQTFFFCSTTYLSHDKSKWYKFNIFCSHLLGGLCILSSICEATLADDWQHLRPPCLHREENKCCFPELLAARSLF